MYVKEVLALSLPIDNSRVEECAHCPLSGDVAGVGQNVSVCDQSHFSTARSGWAFLKPEPLLSHPKISRTKNRGCLNLSLSPLSERPLSQVKH